MKTSLSASKKKAIAIKHAPALHVFHRVKKRLKALEKHKKLESAMNLNIEIQTVVKYPLNEPYAYTRIVRDPFRGNLRYQIVEPRLNESELIQLQRLKDLFMEVVDYNFRRENPKNLAIEYLKGKAKDIMNHYQFELNPWRKEKLLYYVIRDHLGFGKIDALMYDPYIEDISCDGTNINIYIWHRKYESVPTNIRFETAEELESFVMRLAYLCGRHISVAQPMVDASLPDGSRINITFGEEITRRGSTFSIRKFRIDPLTITDMIHFNTISPEIAAYFWYAVENRVSILVSGGIASGKTTLLNCLSMFIKPDLKLVSIEDTPELNLPHENWISTVARTRFGLGSEAADITLFDLLRSSLRQRPDYIIVGEVRGKEAYTLFQAISTGHLGMSTIHGESVDSVVYRLESEPMNIPRTLISGIDIITVQRRVLIGDTPSRRTIITSEIIGLDPRSKEILTNQVYKWVPAGDTFEYTGRSYLIEKIAENKGISLEEANEEIQRRAKVIEWMYKQNIRNYKEVSNIIRRYYENPEFVYREATKSE